MAKSDTLVTGADPATWEAITMRIPTVQGIIDRRILVNYQVDPAMLARMLPAPFRPQLVRGVGVAGICLIRLRQIRPWFLPGWLGVGSENAAHRIAVEWDQDGQMRCGVFVPRRDTSSRLNTIVGGRIFPGMHHHARFDVHEDTERFHIALRSDDDDTRVAVDARLVAELPTGSVFTSLAEASQFFAQGSLGYSPTADARTLEGLELRTQNWQIEPLAVEHVESSFFDDRERFPAGTIRPDSAFLMRSIRHSWHSQPAISQPTAECCALAGAT